MPIRECTETDSEAIVEIINDAAQSYRGVIPADCWHEPYISLDQLKREMADGIRFLGMTEAENLVGIIGIQDKGAVCVIRHAYVRTAYQRKGIGASLLKHVESLTTKPLLIGIWLKAGWAFGFFLKRGYALPSREKQTSLLQKYWTMSEHQAEAHIVMADHKWCVQDMPEMLNEDERHTVLNPQKRPSTEQGGPPLAVKVLAGAEALVQIVNLPFLITGHILPSATPTVRLEYVLLRIGLLVACVALWNMKRWGAITFITAAFTTCGLNVLSVVAGLPYEGYLPLGYSADLMADLKVMLNVPRIAWILATVIPYWKKFR